MLIPEGLPENPVICGRKYWRSSRHGAGDLRLPETAWFSKWKNRSPQSRPLRTYSTFFDIQPAPRSVEIAPCFCLLNQEIFSMNRLSYSSSCKIIGST